LKHFTASDGARIAYQDEGSGRALVLLHGLMAHSGFFERQRALASEFRLIGIDLRGHGESAGGGSPSVEQLAEDVAGIAEALELEQAIVVGWSLGAPVLWHVLSGPAADRFAGAVVVDMTPRVLNDGEWQLGLSQEICEARRLAIRDDFPNFAIGAGQAMFAQPVREEHRALADWAGEEFARNDPAAIDALWSSLIEQDFRPVLSKIRQPTLVIHGAHSQLYGSDTAKYLVGALPNARAMRFDRSGHAPQLEQPDLFNATIRDFAASLPRVRASHVTA
jgi:pimeloyl-[acyl-carrier protein] methyl ester esterase